MRTVRETIIWYTGGALIVLAVRFLSAKELAAIGVVFLLGIFWRLSDIRDEVHCVAEKLGYRRIRTRKIDELMKKLLRDELTKPQNEELDEIIEADQYEGPATWGQLVRVIELLHKMNKRLATEKWHKKVMRDEHGTSKLVYENEVSTALQKGWTLPEFSVVLKDVGPNSINVVRAVREVTGLGLEEAKELVDFVPSRVAQVFTKEEASLIREKFEDVGATVEIE